MPDLVSDIKKTEDKINAFENMGRRYMLMSIAAVIIGLAIISAIVFYIVKAVSKGHVVPSDANLFTSKLKINAWLLGIICIGLCIITYIIKEDIIDKHFPQFKPENLEAEIDKFNSITDITNILNTSFISTQTSFQKGGKKINKTNIISESYFKIKI